MMGEQRFSIVTHNSWHEMPNIKAELLDKNYHYRVIDIKFSKLHFNTDEITLRNN